MERLDKEFDNLPGDCLIATGFVAYLGPFVSEYREALMMDWFMEVRKTLGTRIKFKRKFCEYLGLVVKPG